MGGSSKPADPKVTPFVEPAAPSNPIPNYFGQAPASGGMYKPDFGASNGAFGAPQQATQDEQPSPAVTSPMQPQTAPYSAPAPSWGNGGTSQMQQSNQMTPFSIPTRRGLTLQDGQARAAQNAGGMVGFDPMNFMQGLQNNPNGIMDMIGKFTSGFQNAPRYKNYTDTTPGLSTDENGAFRPDLMFGGFNGR